jgi:hypothetical protein
MLKAFVLDKSFKLTGLEYLMVKVAKSAWKSIQN